MHDTILVSSRCLTAFCSTLHKQRRFRFSVSGSQARQKGTCGKQAKGQGTNQAGEKINRQHRGTPGEVAVLLRKRGFVTTTDGRRPLASSAPYCSTDYKRTNDILGDTRLPFWSFSGRNICRDIRLDMRLVKKRTQAWDSWGSHPQVKSLSTTTTSQRRVPVLSLSRSPIFGGVGHNEVGVCETMLSQWPRKSNAFYICKPPC